MSLSFLRMPTTSSVIDFTRASGAGCWACATGISNANSKQEEIFMATRSGLLGGFIITFLALPGWIAVVDKMASALQPGIAHEGVFVERCLLNNARGVEKVGTIADRARRIEKKPAEIIYSLLKFALQHVIHRNPDVLEVGKEIRNTGADDSRQHGAVGFRHWLDDRIVRGVVEAEHHPVERLERVGRVAPRSGAARQRPGEEQRRAQSLGPCHALGFQSLLTSCRRLRQLYCTGTDR